MLGCQGGHGWEKGELSWRRWQKTKDGCTVFLKRGDKVNIFEDQPYSWNSANCLVFKKNVKMESHQC